MLLSYDPKAGRRPMFPAQTAAGLRILKNQLSSWPPEGAPFVMGAEGGQSFLNQKKKTKL